MTLTPKQRAHLRSLAHHLKPIHHLGREGISDSALSAITEAFNSRELIKVKVQEASPLTAKEAGPLLVERLPGLEHVQTIGRTVVLYRRHPQKAEITFPAG